MNKYISLSLINALLFMIIGIGCAKANQNSISADDSQAIEDVRANIEENHENPSDDLNQLGENDGQYITIRMKGSIGSEQVTMLLRDMEDALDENGDNWGYSGNITYSESGKSYKVKGYIRHRGLFLDAFDDKEKKLGYFELVGEFYDDVQGYEGTYRNLESGKEDDVRLMEEF